MSGVEEGPFESPTESSDAPPDWALQQATEELHDVDDAAVVRRRAQEIERHARSLEDERHTEWDDPDEGGEA